MTAVSASLPVRAVAERDAVPPDAAPEGPVAVAAPGTPAVPAPGAPGGRPDAAPSAQPAPVPGGGHLAVQHWPGIGRPGLLVPLGSLEQHGPHLPLHTDTAIAEAVAAGAARRLAELDCLVAPPLAYGASGEHAGFPGTVSIGLSALRIVLIELARSVADWAAWIVFVNGHGGNLAAVRDATVQLQAEGHRAAWIGCGVPGGDAHAGRTETSLLLQLHPSQVDLPAAVPGEQRPVAEIIELLRERGVRAVSDSGVLGDPRGANAQEGERMLAWLVAQTAGRIRAFAGGAATGDDGMLRRPPAAAQQTSPAAWVASPAVPEPARAAAAGAR